MKKLTTSLLTTALIAPLLLGPMVANAAEEVVAEKGSEAHVTMKKRKPTDPGENDGPLRMESISTINFGDQYISGSTAKYSAIYTETDKVAEGEYAPTTIVVNDDRGTNQGWSLLATASAFKTEATGIDEEARILAGAFLTLKNGKGNEAGGEGSDLENPGATPASASIALQGADVVIATAAKDDAAAAGVGRTSVFFGGIADDTTANNADNVNPDVMLTIPGKAKKAEDATYTAEITWTLLDDPSTK